MISSMKAEEIFTPGDVSSVTKRACITIEGNKESLATIANCHVQKIKRMSERNSLLQKSSAQETSKFITDS